MDLFDWFADTLGGLIGLLDGASLLSAPRAVRS